MIYLCTFLAFAALGLYRLVTQKGYRGGVELKEWKCVQVGHHKNVGETIEEWETAGWRLHTYVCAGNATIAMGTMHYLLFEKGK